MTGRQPFAKSSLRRQAARIEFDIFREQAEDAILTASKEVPGFDVLENYFIFFVTLDHPDTVQASFGSRSMFRKDPEGKVARESGVHLLYSLGPAGDVVVTLYPSKSSLAKVAEDQLYIGVGRYSAYQLLKRVKSDMRSLVAYGYVSSLDAEPTWSERLRIAWLRRSKPSQVDGKFVAGGSTLIGSSLRATYRSALLGAFTAVMRPVGYVIVALVLAYYGKTAWIDFFRAK